MSASHAQAIGTRQIRVALVNNMPDAAFVDTERQFRRVVAVDPDAGGVDLELYAIADVPRSEATQAEVGARYRDLDELWEHPPDALIITGTEPVQTKLPYEPYWPVLARLLEWAATSVPTTMLSCLAAHASILLFDRIERTPLPTKCCGVFAGTVGSVDEPLTAGLADRVPVPHSRVNDVPEAELVNAGYRIIIGSDHDRAGWAVAARNYREGLMVLCQGHPEYSALSLLREYRRDVRRFLLGHGAFSYPSLPEGYLRADGAALLERFAERAAAPSADAGALWASFPFDDAAVTVENSWASSSSTLYSNWLNLARGAFPSGTPAHA
jgi:homoserine O-succinyltransferase